WLPSARSTRRASGSTSSRPGAHRAPRPLRRSPGCCEDTGDRGRALGFLVWCRSVITATVVHEVVAAHSAPPLSRFLLLPLTSHLLDPHALSGGLFYAAIES